MELNIHNVRAVLPLKPVSLEGGAHYTSITVVTDEGERFKLTLFADNPQCLKPERPRRDESVRDRAYELMSDTV